MRTANVSYSVNGEQRSGKITYPDPWCFAFNPCYVEFDMDEQMNNILTLTLQANLTSYPLSVSLFHGKASVYISKVLQLFFTEPEKVRSVAVQLSVTDGDTNVLIEDLMLNAVWGCLKIGEQFGKYGAYKWNGKDLSHIRNVVWFKNFPFYVSMFRAKSSETASAQYDDVVSATGLRIFRCIIGSVVEGDLPEFYTSTKTLSNPRIVLNKTHGVVYAFDGPVSVLGEKAYASWGANGIYGSVIDYMYGGEIRTDTEFAYNGNIVRWNKDTNELETLLVGYAGTEGIFDLNPAITFPDAKKRARYIVAIEKATSAIFNMNFDFPFPDTSKICYEKVNMRISGAKDGLYLRWLDRFGFLQFYLFREGTSTVKSKPSSDTVQVERQYSGMYYGGMERPTEITNEETIKCCAVNLPKDILEYVKTIVNAPIVDLYLGKSRSGTELWLPVSVSSGSYSTDPKTMLSDYEIVIEKTDNISQTL